MPSSLQKEEAKAIPGTMHTKMIRVKLPSQKIDSFPMLASSFRVIGLPDSLYTLDWANAVIHWKKQPSADSVRIYYRVFPMKFSQPVTHMSYDSVMNNFSIRPYLQDYGKRSDDGFFQFGKLNYSGSFGRGLSFGNSQDAVVTSNLNLQLSGYLADSLEILAAITDNNIPVQPDGTTQQLNEFDRIFLKFRRPGWELNLGDIDLRQQQGYFLNFYKRLQGLSFETSYATKNTTQKTLVSGSVAKGKFTRHLFQGQEGNQGPYRLQGANNEFYFVVLANTERVFIDGELLQRGEDRDYIINYNTAEILFTAKRMITKDSRIQVEFEYADRNYLNSNLYFAQEATFGKKAALRFGFFQNGDARNSPIQQALDKQQKNFLAQIGDSIQQAFYPNAVYDSFSVGKILYKKIDTLVAGIRDTIYVFSTNPDSAHYALSFADVGQGNGDYVPDFNGANGKVYKWMAPINGIRQGRYQPAIFLVTPKRLRVMNLGVDYQLSRHTQLKTEGAFSYYDKNLFSSKDKREASGFAGKWQLQHSDSLQLAGKQWQWNADAGMEWVQASFRPLERLRNVEFTRDWGLPLQVNALADETILSGGINLKRESDYIGYKFTSYGRGDGFMGFRNTVEWQQSTNGWQFRNLISHSNVKSITDKGYFFRPQLLLQKELSSWKKHVLEFQYQLEQNAIKSLRTDSMAAQSFSFQIMQAGLKSDLLKPNRWALNFINRQNRYPYGKELLPTDNSNSIQLTADLMRNENRQFHASAMYRSLDVSNPIFPGLKSDKSLLSRLEYRMSEWQGLLNSDLLYETGAGQEQKRDLTYIEVPAGQGEFTWNDYNGDGVQQLNEFELAVFRDQAKYIRIFTPTNEFIKANYNSFNYSLQLVPRALLHGKDLRPLQRFLAKLQLQSTLQMQKKQISAGALLLSPWSGGLKDSGLISLNARQVNTLAYNRSSNKWGFDLVQSNNSNRALLAYGYESRSSNEYSFRARWNIGKTFTTEWLLRKSRNRLQNSAKSFGNRNYDIGQMAAEPRLSYTLGSNFRAQLSYRWQQKRNAEGDQEQADFGSVNAEMKYNLLQSLSLQSKFTLTDIRFRSLNPQGAVNSPSSYILLEGLLPGKNYLWNLDLTKKLSNSLEMTIQYEGRKPGSARMVHVGRAGIRALL